MDIEKIGNGYDGWSMSNNARDAYANGEMPISKWSKTEILNRVREINPKAADLLKNVSVFVLKEKVLKQTSWHHTSMKYNKTAFYIVDEDLVNSLTEKQIAEWSDIKKTVSTKTYKGNFTYVKWIGNGRNVKANVQNLENVNIEERGSFYYVTDNDGSLIVKKKIGSNGTFVKTAEEIQKAEERRKSAQEYIRKREQKHYDNSTNAAKELLAEMNGKYEESRMGYRYTVNRKPHPYDYDNLSEFFNKGEKRLAPNVNGGFYVQEWDGNRFIPADNEYVNIKYSAKAEKSDEELADIADENSSNDKCMDELNPIRHREPTLSL